VAEAAADNLGIELGIDPRQLRGIKPLRKLLPLLASLHEVGCGRDAAGNRELHFDQYVTLVLLWMFNPMLDSLRALQKAAGLEKVAEQLGVKRFSLGSFSESVRVFDPGKLQAVVERLAGELQPLNADGRLDTHLLGRSLKLVDATVLDAIATVARAAWVPFQDGTAKHAWKLHVHFDFDTFCPEPGGLELTDARNSAQERREERAASQAQGRLLLRHRPLVRPVHAVQRNQRHQLELRLPR